MTSVADLVEAALAFRSAYLAAHPEVAAAVKAGACAPGSTVQLQELVVAAGREAQQDGQQPAAAAAAAQDGQLQLQAPSGGGSGGAVAAAPGAQLEMVAQGGTGGGATSALPPAGATATLTGPVAAPVQLPPPGPSSPPAAAAPAAGLRQRAASWLSLTRTLAWRERLIITRNPADVAGRMLIFTWVAIIAGLMNYGTGGGCGWAQAGTKLEPGRASLLLLPAGRPAAAGVRRAASYHELGADWGGGCRACLSPRRRRPR